MSDLGAGVGTAIEGSLLSRALDPGSGARQPHPHQPANCLNCGAALMGAYCHACGQQAHLHRTFGAFMHDLLHGALHFEGKMWRTLPLLALRPGTLTRRYIEGARARFVSPMALFLFSVFLMFAIFQALGVSAPTQIQGGGQVVEGLVEARERAQREVQDTRDALAALPPRDPARPALERQLADAEASLEAMERITGFGQDADERGIVLETGIGFIDKSIIAKWREDPELMLYKLQSNSYKFSWLLIPLSIPFVWLLFAWKRGFTAFDHAIFVTYSLSFMSLLFIALSLLRAAGVGTGLLALAVLLVPPVHMYQQLRGAYSLRRRSALWRVTALYAMIGLILALFLQTLIVLGAF
jgi:hypothetical protein